MRKLLLSVVLLTLLFTLVMPASAAGGVASVTSSGGVAPGETITFTVSISGADPVLAAMITPTFDKDVFELVSGAFLRSGVMADFSGGDGVIAWSSPTDINGDLLTFTLKAKDTAVTGKSYTVGCSYVISNANDERETGNIKGSTVTILCKHSFTVKKADAKYLCSGATCTAKAKYYLSCALCGAAGTGTFEVGEMVAHDFSEKDTADQYTKVAGNCKTYGEYYYSCCYCGAKGSQTFVSDTLGDHVYDNDCDADCNVCATSRMVSHEYGDQWVTDQNSHWKACTKCEAKDQAAAHVPGPEATNTEPQICTVCQMILKPADNHVHSYPETWQYDEAGHWHACSCGSVEGLTVHSWGEKTVFKEATAEEEGILRTACQICGAHRDETIAKLPGAQTPAGETEEPSALPVILAVLLVLSLAGNGVLLFLVLKKKHN